MNEEEGSQRRVERGQTEDEQNHQEEDPLALEEYILLDNILVEGQREKNIWVDHILVEEGRTRRYW